MAATSQSPTQKIAQKRILSGLQPSGKPHLGNYFGAMKQHIELQDENTCFYFIANYHALTTVQDAARLRELTQDVAVSYLALGLDPQKVVFYRQSDIPEVCELAWILSTVTGMGLLERAHSFKDKTARGIKPSVGLFIYPALMAADILIVRADYVPVGEDQTQHLEMTQDMAEYFNNTFRTDVLHRPEILLSETPKVPGIDGQKMSKSYGNTIELFAPPEQVRKRIMSIKTDSTPVDQPKNPDTCNLLALLKLFASPGETREWEHRYRTGPLAYGEVKGRLAELFEERFHAARQRHEELIKNPDYVEDVLVDGAQRARRAAEPLMEQVRRACGITRRKR